MYGDVYLVEAFIDVGSRFDREIILIAEYWEQAQEAIKGKSGIITKVKLGKVYPEGIGVCEHQHF